MSLEQTSKPSDRKRDCAGCTSNFSNSWSFVNGSGESTVSTWTDGTCTGLCMEGGRSTAFSKADPASINFIHGLRFTGIPVGFSSRQTFDYIGITADSPFTLCHTEKVFSNFEEYKKALENNCYLRVEWFGVSKNDNQYSGSVTEIPITVKGTSFKKASISQPISFIQTCILEADAFGVIDYSIHASIHCSSPPFCPDNKEMISGTQGQSLGSTFYTRVYNAPLTDAGGGNYREIQREYKTEQATYPTGVNPSISDGSPGPSGG